MYLQSPAVILSSDPPPSIGLLSAYLFFYMYIYIYVCMYLFIYLYMYEEWMKNGWKNAWERITNEQMNRRCSKKSFSKDFGLPSTNNSTWEPNLEWRVLLLLWPNCFWKSAVCQLCAKTHSMFRVPDLFWLTGAVFRNISVTHSKFSKRKNSSKTWDFGPARRNGNFSDTPGDFQKVILCFSPAL